MATSFAIPGQPCSVGQFEQAEREGRIQSSWKDYCDCMFLEPQDETLFLCNGSPIVMPPTVGSDEMARARFAQQYCAAKQGRYSIQVRTVLRRTDNWHKCVYQLCLEPWGCNHPVIPYLKMPMNVSPMAAVAPWTDGGAAARGIPKRNAGLFYDVTALVSIDLKEYEPINLWVTFWSNPAKYALLMAKLHLIPVAGAVISSVVNVTGIPVMLIPLALTQAQMEGKDARKALLDPIGPALIANAQLVLKYFGKCGVGINIPCGAGIVLQRAAQDQIATGEIARVQSDAGKAIIAFCAKQGEALVDSIFAASFSGQPVGGGVFGVMEAGFRAAKSVQGVSEPVQKVLELLALVSGVGARIASGISAGKTVTQIADDVAELLLGFRPSDYFEMLQQGKTQSALDYAAASMKRTGSSVESMTATVDNVGRMFDELIAGLHKLSNTVGGALDGLVEVFTSARGNIDGAAAATKALAGQLDTRTRQAMQQVLAAKQQAGLSKASTPLVTVSGSKARVGLRGTGLSFPSQPASPAVVAKPPALAPPRPPALKPPVSVQPTRTQPGQQVQGSNVGALVAGAGVGFALGGPVGSVVGALALAYAGRK